MQISHTLETLSVHSGLVMALSQNNAPWLQHILQTLHKNGASVRTILCKIKEAISNGYKPCGYDQDEADLVLRI